MFFGLAVMAVAWLVLKEVFGKIKRIPIPEGLGFMLSGMLIGPLGLGLTGTETVKFAPDIFRFLKVILLVHLGLRLSPDRIAKWDRSVMRLAVVAAFAQGLVVLLLGPRILGLSSLDAALLAVSMSSVSSVLLIPDLAQLRIMGYGVHSDLSQRLTEASQGSEVLAVLLFSVLAQLREHGTGEILNLLYIPIALALGVLFAMAGSLLVQSSKRSPILDSLLCLSLAVILEYTTAFFSLPLSGSVAALVLGRTIRKRAPVKAEQIRELLDAVLDSVEGLSCILLGACLTFPGGAGFEIGTALILVLPALLARMGSTFLYAGFQRLPRGEQVFCTLAYVPAGAFQIALCGAAVSQGMDGKPLGAALAVYLALSSVLHRTLFAGVYRSLLVQESQYGKLTLVK